MSNNFKQAITDLENGLASINKVAKDPKVKAYNRNKATIQRDLQIERIVYFRKGYNFARKELKNQLQLP